MQRLMTAGVVFVSLLVAVSAKADTIVNGSFEDPALSSGTWNIYQAITGWTTIRGAGIEVQNGVAGASYDGSQHVELDSNNNSAMRQVVTTVADQVYELSFAFSPRPNQPATTNGIQVYWNGVLLDTLTGTGGAITSWELKTYEVVATGSTTNLDFSATTISDSFGGYIDAVSLTAVPTPSAFAALIGMGLLGMVAGVCRRPKRSA